MSLKETQALLARLFTDARLRREFAADPVGVARRFGFAEKDARRFAAIDKGAVERFAEGLLGKRALDARKAMPLTARALGASYDRLFLEAIEGPPSPGRHRADALAFARRLAALAARGGAAPPWIGDLARYEAAFIEAARPGGVLLFRRFHYPVGRLAAALFAGETPDVAPRATYGLWFRAPGARLFHRLV